MEHLKPEEGAKESFDEALNESSGRRSRKVSKQQAEEETANLLKFAAEVGA